MEKEISETYQFNPRDFGVDGRRKSDGITFREIVKGFEQDFHSRHSTEYALNLYANPATMHLLERACDAAPFLTYGMDLTQGRVFAPVQDPYINHEIEKYSKRIIVYGIDSAYMTECDENGYPVLTEGSGIYPLTLLIDDEMQGGMVRLSVPDMDENEEEIELTYLPQTEWA